MSTSADQLLQVNLDNSINIKKSCRICLAQFDQGISLFEPNESLNNSTAASLVWKCFGIKICRSEELSNQICNECTMNILISHNFRIQLQQSQYLNNYDQCEIVKDQFNIIKIKENIYKIIYNTDNRENEYNDDYKHLINTLKFDKIYDIADKNILLVTEKSDCTICNKDKNNFVETKRMLNLAKNAGPPYECKICRCIYQKDYKTFYAHLRSHFEKKVQCDLCTATYLPSRKKYHLRKHTKEKPYKCQECKKSFSMKNHLNRHLKFSCNMKEHFCNICKQAFNTNKLLYIHLNKLHGLCRHYQLVENCDNCVKKCENKIVCEFCGLKVFRYKRHLNTCKSAPGHLQFSNATTSEQHAGIISEYNLKHQKDQSYVCKECNKTFVQKRYLKDHMEMHKAGNYPCEKCGKVFKRNVLLKMHQRIHTSIKKYTCLICGKTFRMKDHLDKHQVVHTKVKSFTCSVCNKSFGLKGNLTQHLLIHEKLKYFSCSICKKAFAAEGNLKRHLLQHT